MSKFLSIVSLKTEGAPPRYEQIANAVCQAIRTGQLKPGDRLHTVRSLAYDLGGSLTTVTAAFKSLFCNATRPARKRSSNVVEPAGLKAARAKRNASTTAK